MTLFAELNGSRITKCSINLPNSGIWYADVVLSEVVSISGVVKLILSDLTLQGTIAPSFSGSFNNQSSYRLVGGMYNWKKILPFKYYNNDFKLKLEDIINQVAGECGEIISSIVLPTETKENTTKVFTRKQQSAIKTIEQLIYSPTQWWVNNTGFTSIGIRPSNLKINVDYQVLNFDCINRSCEIVTEFPGGIPIGSKIESKVSNTFANFIAKEILITMDNNKLRMFVHS